MLKCVRDNPNSYDWKRGTVTKMSSYSAGVTLTITTTRGQISVIHKSCIRMHAVEQEDVVAVVPPTPRAAEPEICQPPVAVRAPVCLFKPGDLVQIQSAPVTLPPQWANATFVLAGGSGTHISHIVETHIEGVSSFARVSSKKCIRTVDMQPPSVDGPDAQLSTPCLSDKAPQSSSQAGT